MTPESFRTLRAAWRPFHTSRRSRLASVPTSAGAAGCGRSTKAPSSSPRARRQRGCGSCSPDACGSCVRRRGDASRCSTPNPPATLAEVPLFDGGGYVATAIAEDDARLLFVPGPELLALCRRRPEVAFGVIAVLARRLRAFAALIEDLALRDVTARLSRFLLTEARRAGGDVLDLPGTRDDVAARLGTVRELISRSLAQLRGAGVISVHGRRRAAPSCVGSPPGRSMTSENLTTGKPARPRVWHRP